ncbi:DUF5597 domain-containing protein [Ruminococcaceae bacterium OttesenSCG-928-D13]|nr:DUF5597 domain-containing protein [Ruminococcaceae bacterium OttesenSCG-928-D13]
MNIPYLHDFGGKKALMVNGQPFLLLAGEVHNSNSSSVAYMEGVWDKAETLGMNSLLLPITWELLEPEEGVFDFSLVDGLIEQARRRGKKLGLLWFGAWKNAQCYYAPAWVKTNLQRFKRAEVSKGVVYTRNEQFYGIPYTTLSYLCGETNEADARAFRALMRHIKEMDERENTVALVQVENETGLMGAAREHSDEADALFEAEVPAAFAAYMRGATATMAPDVRAAVEGGAAAGNWQAVFGDVAEEIFSAYHTAAYVGRVAAAGKEEYPLPMTANCWQENGQQPGQYPSGGPVSRMMEVWRFCAPSIDVITPDIYARDFCGACDAFTKLSNPLMIPETATHSYAGPRQVWVVGHHHAMGYAPFGFEEMGQPFTAAASFLFGMDTQDPALKTPQNTEEYAWYTRTLQSMMPLLVNQYGSSSLQAVTSERKEEDTMLFGTFGFKAVMDTGAMSMGQASEAMKDGVCLVLQNTEDEFYIIANRCIILPFSTDAEKPNVDFLALEEGCFENGNWTRIRRLNGDEATLLGYDTPTLLRVKLFAYGKA